MAKIWENMLVNANEDPLFNLELAVTFKVRNAARFEFTFAYSR